MTGQASEMQLQFDGTSSGIQFTKGVDSYRSYEEATRILIQLLFKIASTT